MTPNWTNAPLKAIGYAIAVLALCGCTARQAYEGLQQHTRNECITLPLSQQSDCLAQASISFDEYQRLRKEAITN
jgi:hypothetical protein